jgi:hypothetical protein
MSLSQGRNRLRHGKILSDILETERKRIRRKGQETSKVLFVTGEVLEPTSIWNKDQHGNESRSW